MALENKELQQLATLLGEVLAPRIREAVAENVGVRIAALAQTLREEQREALNAERAATTLLVSESTQKLHDVIQENGVQSKELFTTAASASQAFVKAQIAAVVETVTERLDKSEHKVGLLVDSIDEGTALIDQSIEAVRAAIPAVPAIPAPLKLIEEGELSEEMRAAMDVAMRQIMQPVFNALLTPIASNIESIGDNLVKQSETISGIADTTSKDINAVEAKLAEGFAALSENLATKSELKSFDETVCGQLVKIRSEVLAELKEEVNTLESATETRFLQVAENASTVLDAVAESQHTAANVHVQLEAGLQAVREAALATRAEVSSEIAEGIDRVSQLVNDTNAETAKAIATERVNSEKGLLLEVNQAIDGLRNKQAEAAVEVAGALDDAQAKTAALAETVSGVKVEAVTAHVALREDLSRSQAEHAKAIEAVRTEFTKAQSETVSAFETRAKELAGWAEQAAAVAAVANAETADRVAQIAVRLDAANQAIEDRFGLVEAHQQVIVTGAQKAANDASAVTKELAHVVANNATGASTAMQRMSERIEAAHTRTKALSSELNKEFKTLRSLNDSLDAKVVDLEAKRSVDAKAHSVAIESRIKETTELFTEGLSQARTQATADVERVLKTVESLDEQNKTHAVELHKSIETLAGTQAGLGALGAEFADAQARVANEHAELAKRVDGVVKAADEATKATDKAAIRLSSRLDEQGAEQKALIERFETTTTETQTRLSAISTEHADAQWRAATEHTELAKRIDMLTKAADEHGAEQKALVKLVDSTRAETQTRLDALHTEHTDTQTRAAAEHTRLGNRVEEIAGTANEISANQAADRKQYLADQEAVLELIAGAKIETKAGVDALRSEIIDAQTSVETKYATLSTRVDWLASTADEVAQRLSRETSELNGVLSSSLKDVRSEFADTTARLETQFAEGEAGTVKRLDEVERRAEDSTKATTDLVEQTRAHARVSLDAAFTVVRDDLSTARKELSDALAEVDKQHATEIANAKAATSAAMEELNRLVEATHKQAQTDVNASLAAINEALDATRETLADEKAVRMADLAACMTNIRNVDKNLLGVLEDARVKTRVEFEAALQGVRGEAEAMQAELAKALDALQKSGEASRETLVQSLADAVGDMRQAYKDVETRCAEISTSLTNTVSVLRTEAESGVAAVRSETKTLLDAAIPEILEKSANAAAQTVALAVPDAVAKQTEGLPERLSASLVPLAVAEATRVATEAGESALGAARGLVSDAVKAVQAARDSAVEQAKTEAATVARIEATAAAQGLREDLAAALDPTELIAKTIREAVPLEVQDSVRQQMGQAEPRLYVDLAAKIQKEIDRIPRPRDGRDGDPGANGRDARVAAPVPYEIGKRYDFGAWVAHNNGVWVAARNTDAEPAADSADWDCVTPGIKAIESVLQEDGRTIELHFELTNGSLHKSVLKMPIQIPRGVFDAQREYDVHDLCTFDGSQWIAQKAGKLPRPGTDPAWKLSVKHGKDGKDLKQPAPQVIRHMGEWQPDTEYPTNVTVDHAGVRWLAMRSTRERPPFTTLVSNDTWTKLGA